MVLEEWWFLFWVSKLSTWLFHNLFKQDEKQFIYFDPIDDSIRLIFCIFYTSLILIASTFVSKQRKDLL